MSYKHITIIAGEASGDQHAAHLVSQLKQLNPALEFSGIGGIKMQQAGVSLTHNLAQYAVVGVVEVINHFKVIRDAFNTIKQALIKHQPDLLILVDYPGFNLRLAKFAKSLGIKILFYISPQIWAWKAKRIITLKKTVEMMAVILPFEKKLYQDADIPVRFVGHPLTTSVKTSLTTTAARLQFGLKQDSTVIGLLPGSRKMELKHMLPVMLEAAAMLAAQHPNLEFVLPLASSLSTDDLTPYLKHSKLKLKIVHTHYYDLINCCHSLVVASGTASLEAALLAKPMAIVFKTSAITYTIASQVIRVKYIGLCNLLAQQMLVPEIIQHDLTAPHIYQVLNAYLTDTTHYHATIAKLHSIRDLLGEHNIDCNLPELVLELLEGTPSS